MAKFLAVVMIFLQAVCAMAATEKPVRLVRLPIIWQNFKVDKETRAVLETKFARATNVPLNGTLNAVDYVNPKSAQKTFAEIIRRYDDDGRKFSLAESVRTLAEELDADLVVCPILRRYSQTVTPAVKFGETRLDSNAAAELVVYDRRTDTLAHKKTSRSHSGEYSKFGTASYLAGECFDELIQKTELREIIRAIR